MIIAIKQFFTALYYTFKTGIKVLPLENHIKSRWKMLLILGKNVAKKLGWAYFYCFSQKYHCDYSFSLTFFLLLQQRFRSDGKTVITYLWFRCTYLDLSLYLKYNQWYQSFLRAATCSCKSHTDSNINILYIYIYIYIYQKWDIHF